jgi:crossover junction endodeoxyribonuclease RuvC
MIIAGVDPGLEGALAVLVHSGNRIAVTSHDLPILRIGTTSGRQRAEIDSNALAGLLADAACSHLFVEKVGPMPKQGVTGVFRFGFVAGVIEGLAAGLQIPLSYVRPQVWQKHHAIGPGPDAARQRCLQLFPNIGDQLRRKRDCHRADAILVGAYGFSQL